MAAKTPIRTVYDGSTATGLAEFQSGEFIAVEHGGTGNTSLTSNSILLGNGTSAVASSTIQISSNTISSSNADAITIGDNLNVSGNIVATGNITANGDITIGDSATDTVTITADVSSNLIPSVDSTYTLGDSSNAWSNLFVDTLTLGGTAITSTATELNILDGVTATTTELNYVDGVTSNIQTQLNTKAPTANATLTGTTTYATLNDGTTSLTATVAELNTLDGITSTVAELNLLDGVTASTTELNYLDGVTSNIQTQIDNISSDFTLSADSGTNDTFTTGGTLTFTGGTGVDTTVSNDTITFAIGQAVATSSNVTFNSVTSSLTGNVTGNLTGDVTGDLTGDVTGNVTGNLTGDVTGTVSDVSNHNTDDISEGSTNQYYTNARARGALSASGDVSYSSSTGVISFSETYSTAAELLTAIKTVDGSGSGLDADTLDGFTSGEFLTTTSVSPSAFAATSSTAYNISDYGNLTNDTGTAGFVNEPIRATAYQDLALPGTTVSVDWGDLS